MCAPAGVLCLFAHLANRRQTEARYPGPPRASPPSPAHASKWPKSRRGRKGPTSSSVAQLDPERPRWILKANATETLLRLNMSHLYQQFPFIFPGRLQKESKSGCTGLSQALDARSPEGTERSSLSSCRNKVLCLVRELWRCLDWLEE